MTNDLVHFSGDWPDEDRNLVALALSHIEASEPASDAFTFGSRWVCVLEKACGRTFYMGHRLSDTRSVWATSIEDFLGLARERVEEISARKRQVSRA